MAVAINYIILLPDFISRYIKKTPAGEGSGNYSDIDDPNATDLQGNPNRPSKEGYTAWKNGQTYFGNLWVGYSFGNHIERIGYSHPIVQDRTQNVVHRWLSFGRQNYYNKYDFFDYGIYSYGGYNSPYTLWGK